MCCRFSAQLKAHSTALRIVAIAQGEANILRPRDAALIHPVACRRGSPLPVVEICGVHVHARSHGSAPVTLSR
jgi:hypothetical protein